MNDALGDRMKHQYEDRTRYCLPRRTYTIVRVDGRAFHTWTKGLEEPFDARFMDIMDDTAKHLVASIQGSRFAFVQSDEISVLLTDFDSAQTEAWMDGNLQKIVSLSASMTTACFNNLTDTGYWNLRPPAQFDARAFTIPDPIEVENYFIWRQKDTERNSLQMVARAFYSHKELIGIKSEGLHDLLMG